MICCEVKKFSPSLSTNMGCSSQHDKCGRAFLRGTVHESSASGFGSRTCAMTVNLTAMNLNSCEET
jgi:hypothetical protein